MSIYVGALVVDAEWYVGFLEAMSKCAASRSWMNELIRPYLQEE
jgi:hypothetical protein